MPEAVALLRVSLRRHPTDPGLRRELGLALIDQATIPNDFAAALAILHEAARQGDQSAAIAVALARNDATGLPSPGQARSDPEEKTRLKLTRAIIASRGE